MQALIDGDIVAFRNAVSCESKDKVTGELHLEPVEIALIRTDIMMRNILRATKAETYKVYLSGSTNFRYTVCPEYKANRKDKINPVWLQQCKEFLVTEWGAIVCDHIEADDALGINQTPETIICSIDKDLKQIPGNHYNFVKEEFFSVTPLEGLQWFYQQLLIGDTTDNIIGIKGIGPVKAQKAINTCKDEVEMFQVVRDLYKDDARLAMNGKLLWILQEEEGIWNPQPLFAKTNANSSNNTISNDSSVAILDVQK